MKSARSFLFIVSTLGLLSASPLLAKEGKGNKAKKECTEKGGKWDKKKKTCKMEEMKETPPADEATPDAATPAPEDGGGME